MESANLKKVTDILHRMHGGKDELSDSGYSSDKRAIHDLFTKTEKGPKESYLLRLTVIDSLYSTQMNRRYYALEELAEALCTIQQNSTKQLQKLFQDYLKTHDAHLFDYSDGSNKKKNLFSESYGIGKDGDDKGVAISLISKYAYFATNYEFPIFDSIACEMYPRIWNYCQLPGKPAKLVMKENMKIQGIETMDTYVTAIDQLIAILGGGISYDHLDRLLWFTGKIIRGNLSLVLPREQYEICANNSKFRDQDNKFHFNIKEHFSDLNFLKKDTILYSFFELAKDMAEKLEIKIK